MSADAVNRPKDIWDKLGVVAQFLIPISVILVAFIVNSALKQREIRAEYVRLAVAALQSPDDTGPAREVKRWALNVLREMSPVPIPPELEAEALRVPIERGRNTTNSGFGAGWGFVEVLSIPQAELFIYVDGKVGATTPTTFSLPTGRHTIELRTSEGKSLGASEVQLMESPSQMVIFCRDSNSVVSGPVRGIRMTIRRGAQNRSSATSVSKREDR